MKIYISIPTFTNKKVIDKLKEKAQVVVAKKRPSQEEFEEIIKNFDGVIIGRLQCINKKILKNSNLKFVGIIAKGTDNIDLISCKNYKVPVFYTPNANITSVAEHVFALILSLSKNLFVLDNSVRNNEFDKHRLTTFDIRNKTLGIIGAGPISREIIKRANAFDMKILCHTKNPKNHTDMKVDFVSLKDLLISSDYVSVNIPLNEETHNFIGEDEISHMKKTAYLINTSRGKIVNENALIKALKENKIAGAGIDVFENEISPNKDLLALKNVVLTPHVAGVSKEALERMEEHLVTDIVSFLEGRDIKYRLV